MPKIYKSETLTWNGDLELWSNKDGWSLCDVDPWYIWGVRSPDRVCDEDYVTTSWRICFSVEAPSRDPLEYDRVSFFPGAGGVVFGMHNTIPPLLVRCAINGHRFPGSKDITYRNSMKGAGGEPGIFITGVDDFVDEWIAKSLGIEDAWDSIAVLFLYVWVEREDLIDA